MDEVVISKAITESYTRDLIDFMDVDVAIVGAGPSGLTAGYYLAKNGVKSALYERRMSTGGGIWGGGMMFSKIVVESEARWIMDEFGVKLAKYQEGYYVADAVETAAALSLNCIQTGTRILNLLTVEDVLIRDNDRVSGLVLNWSAVPMSNLHIDPLTIKAKLVIDATGHEANVCCIVARKIGEKLNTRTGGVVGEKSMWAEVGERELVANTGEIYPGLMVTGMAVNAALGYPRMGAIFGGMLLSGKKVADLAIDMLRQTEG